MKLRISIGLTLLLALALFAIFVPLLSPYCYEAMHLSMKNLPPSFQFWFGTDELGRDLLCRTAYGARISLTVGTIAALIDLLIGVVWGGVAAFFGGKVDQCMMRIADILYSIPYLLVVILLIVIMGTGLVPLLIALTFTGWIGMARIVRGQILQLKNQEFVLAALTMGASSGRLLFKHLVPHTYGVMIVTLTLTIPSAIFTEAFLSFLGIGISAPLASWGTMANDALSALRTYPWRLFFPAFFISLTLLACNLLGDGLREQFDIKKL